MTNRLPACARRSGVIVLAALVTVLAVVPARGDWIDAFPGGESEQFWDFTFNPPPFVSGSYRFATGTSGTMGSLTITAARPPLPPGLLIGYGVVPTESFAGRGVVVRSLVNPSGTVPGGPNVGVVGMVDNGPGTGYLATISTTNPSTSTLSLVKATGSNAIPITLGTATFGYSATSPYIVELETLGPNLIARVFTTTGRLLQRINATDGSPWLEGFAGLATWEPAGVQAAGNWGTTSARGATENGGLTWAPTGSVPSGTAAMATGTWSPTSLTWISSTSVSPPVKWDPTQPAIFGTSGTTVVVSGSTVRIEAGMRFLVGGYRLTSNTASHTLILGGTGPVITVDDTPRGSPLLVATMNLPLTGTTGFRKTGGGVLALTATNTYTGTTAIAEGVVSISTTTALPGWDTPGRYGVSPGATLAVRNGVADSSVTTILGTGNIVGGSLGFDTITGDRTYGLAITGSIGLRKIGSNRLTLTNTNAYLLGTIVSEGQLEITSTSALPGWNQSGRWSIDSSAVLVVPNAITDQEVDTLLLTGNVGDGGFGFNTAAGDRSHTLPISGPQSLYKLGVNTLTLTGSSVYTGATQIDNGVLAVAILANIGSSSSIGTGTASPTILIGGSATAGTLRYVGSGTAMTDRRVSIGASGGQVESAGTGPLVFTAGTFNAPNPAITTSSTLTLAGGNSGTNTIVGTIANTSTSASLVLVKDGTGTWILSGSNSYSGGTIVSAGSLIGTSTSLRGAIANNAMVEFNQATSGTYAGLMSGTGSLTKSGAGILTLTGSNSFTGDTRVVSGSLALQHKDALAGSSLNLDAGDTGSVVFALTGTNTYTLGGLKGSRNLPLGVNSLVVGANGQSTSYSGTLSGSGSLTKTGSGALTLTGTHTYSGGTIVSAGSLIGTTTSLRGAITNNALVEFSQATSGTYAGLMSGSGSLTKSGSGLLAFTGSNAVSGSTTVRGGVLQMASAAALSASRLVVVAGGTGQVAPQTMTSVASLDLDTGNGLLDVTSGGLTILGSMTAPQLMAELLEGRGDGSWTGTSGITSSTAAAEIALSAPRAVGWLDNGDGSLTVAYAALGDTNLDWSIDILDASNFLAPAKFDTGTPAIWKEGDFSYDGVVDILDAADFFSTGLYDAGSYNAVSGAAGVAAVPEPAGIGFVAIAGVAAWLAARVRWKDRRRL